MQSPLGALLKHVPAMLCLLNTLIINNALFIVKNKMFIFLVIILVRFSDCVTHEVDL